MKNLIKFIDSFIRIHIIIIILYILGKYGEFDRIKWYPIIIGLLSIVWIWIPFINDWIKN